MPTTVAGAVAELRALAAAVGDLPGAAAIDADLVAAVGDAYRRRPPPGPLRLRGLARPVAVAGPPDLYRRPARAGRGRAGAGRPGHPLPQARPGGDGRPLAELVLLPSEPYAFAKADADEVAAAFPRRRG